MMVDYSPLNKIQKSNYNTWSKRCDNLSLILKATSSPLSSKANQRRETNHWSESSLCPDVSPIKISPLNKIKQPQFLDSPARQSTTNTPVKILESSGIEMDLLVFPDISPIKDNPDVNDAGKLARFGAH